MIQPPPIPRQSRHQPRQKPHHQNHPSYSSTYTRPLESRQGTLPPASPEVISSLITSLSVISKPASNHFEGPAINLSAPGSPREGSFGVDYGAYSAPSQEEDPAQALSLDELAASPPVIRTAKPPSGFSPLTAPKSPSHEPSSFKSFLRTASRPSSKGSLGSRDDTQSIGNLSIERGAVPSHPELHKKRSHDSWGKKQGRSHKGLMYMSSKERLRERELEKKRASIGAVGGNGFSPVAISRPDPFLAETPITEEVHESPKRDLSPEKAASMAATNSDMPSPRPIPTRDSSLRKTGSGSKRSSARNSRSKRESDTPADTIHEGVEHGRHRDTSTNKPLPTPNPTPEVTILKHPAPQNVTTTTITREFPSSSSSKPQKPHTTHYRSPSNSRLEGMNIHPHSGEELETEDFAPFPSVAQGRRRDASYDRGRRRSGQITPDPLEGVKLKRSSSKLKRGSGALSPRMAEDKNGGNRSRLSSPEPSPVPAGYERPRSADSIDDAVESYLCSPRLSQKIRHPQTGRVISFSEVGDSEGSAVFCCVGMGLTRYITAFYDELALTLKLRLITPDRPGVGDSEPYADGTATPLSWPDDVYAICQALKINKFSILAHSAGAIYALATALRMPQHIRGRIHLLAPWIPPSQMNVFGTSQNQPPTNAIPTSQRILRALPTPILKAANSSFMSATSSSITSSLPKTPRRGKRKSSNNAARADAPTLTGGQHANGVGVNDKENMSFDAQKTNPDMPNVPNATENMDLVRPTGGQGARLKTTERAVINAAANAMADKERQMTYDTRLTHAIWELATTGANPAVDLLVCLERRHTIGFRYVDITRPVVIHHGSRDTRVPVENVRWLGKTMRRCEVRVLEGEGHGLMASATVMGSVLMEISKEWEDWMRVTGASRTRSGDRGRRLGTAVR
ncbi:hypothetical protein jhhlp_006786 [Lomentospora prolificans]|uniref:AB hydrolase-1 domain-containing protein n=1 Tax=Lomentospora prolificans TaxID=41688 RepID=A0A2N3N2S0_9PEZI|nr:hypothetical protein jhhlp_006786 [Lomentospora prolificans]